MGSSTKDVQPKTEFLYPPPLTKLQPFSPVRGENINAIWTSVDRGLSCVSDSEAQNILSLCMSCLWSTPPPRTWAFKLVHTPPPPLTKRLNVPLSSEIIIVNGNISQTYVEANVGSDMSPMVTFQRYVM